MKPSKDSSAFQQAISVALMRESDAYTIEHFVPSVELMYRAAWGVFEAVNWSDRSIAIFVGSGNNGGDGYALAGILAERGMMPTVLQTSEKRSKDGEYYYQKAFSVGVKPELFTPGTNLSRYDIVVDCILGTGFQGAPRGMAACAIEAINHSSSYVVSVDINSGMNGDTGEAVLAVRSDLTVSIGYYKKGMFLGRAPELIGDLTNVDIGIKLLPQKTATQVVAALIWDKDRFLACQRPANKARGLLWEFVGGKVEPGETKEEALIRECREELDITVSVGEVFMEVVHEYHDLTVQLTLFHASIVSGTPKLLEHNAIRWITTQEIDALDFCPADDIILERLKQQ